jgi:hypothetical protein
VLTKIHKWRAHLLGVLAVLMIACDVTALLTPAAGPTPTAGQHGTVSAQAAGVDLTQPSVLAVPTETAVSTPIPTRTAIITPTPTLTPFLSASEGELDCRVLSQSVRNGARIGARERFEMGWKVRNRGTLTWDPENVDFVYFSGTRMYQAERFNLPTAVNSGETVALGASLLAPKNSGSYATVWALRRGENRFCHVSLRIVVP